MMREYRNRSVRSYVVTALFKNTFPNRLLITKSTSANRHSIWTDSVKDRLRIKRLKTASNDDKNIEVLQSFVKNSYVSIQKVSQQYDISKSTVQRTLK